ncbi:MAG: DUF2339 domain-containing protein, partial [Zoogloeaceae bacterium]|nr:DUF2339 domain-containing protein [Zoogloeaceae bacterium]
MAFCIVFVVSVLLLFVADTGFWDWWVFGVAVYFWYVFQSLKGKVQTLQEQMQALALQGELKDKAAALREKLRSKSAALLEQATPAPFSAPPAPSPAPMPEPAVTDASAFTPIEPPPATPVRAVPASATESFSQKTLTPFAVEPPSQTIEPLPDSPQDVPVQPDASISEYDQLLAAHKAAQDVPVQLRTPVTYQPSAFEELIEKVFVAGKDWLLGGNTVVRVGLVVFFMGLAWLLRYASERYAFPVEARYIGVSIVALVMLVLGWRLRLKKPAYALTLQGGGIAVLYLTTFAAMRLHALISPEGAFVAMLALTAAAVLLAIAQDAMALACAAVLGGFASPILVSTGGGNHVILFSYLALLNTGIALIAWFKAWRVLNLIGFVGTFGLGLAWGLRSYTPEKFASTEPFLILFLLMFVLIGLLFARRKLMAQENGTSPISPWSEANTDYLDGTLAFGPPVIGFGLQCAVISHIEYGMAFSALALGLLYFALAFCLRGRPRIRLMTEVYLALGIVFATLAIPLAFDAEWTSAAWALEGAGIYWIGQIQRRPLARAFALLLMVLASFAYLGEISLNSPLYEPLLAGSPTGSVVLGIAYLACYFVRRRSDEAAKTGEQPIDFALGIAGLAFLYLVAPLVFDRDDTVIAWALAGALTLFPGVWLFSRTFIVGAFAIQVIGGLLILGAWTTVGLFDFDERFQLMRSTVPVACALALAGFLSAWRLYHAASHSGTGNRDVAFSLTPGWMSVCSNLLLVWSIGWWVWHIVASVSTDYINYDVFSMDYWRPSYIFLNASHHAKFVFRHDWRISCLILLQLSLSAALWMMVARYAKWRSLALACLLPTIVAALVLANHGVILHWDVGITWGVFFLAHFLVLRLLSGLLPEDLQRVAHVAGAWLGILALTLTTTAICNRFMPDKYDSALAWYWLSWALVPTIYLWLTLRERIRFWPLAAFTREYRLYAAFPVSALLMIWFWSANLTSEGVSAPLPYIPVLNPLELGLLLVLFVCWRWCFCWIPKAQETQRKTIALIGGVSLFALATQAVCRVAHAWMGV